MSPLPVWNLFLGRSWKLWIFLWGMYAGSNTSAVPELTGSQCTHRKFNVQIQHSTQHWTIYFCPKSPGQSISRTSWQKQGNTTSSSKFYIFAVSFLGVLCCYISQWRFWTGSAVSSWKSIVAQLTLFFYFFFQFGQWINFLGLGLQSSCSLVEKKPKGEGNNTEDQFEQDSGVQ